MRPLTLNLARRPFANVRPVHRAAVLLWTIGAILLVVNAYLYWRHFSGEGQSEKVLRDIISRAETEVAAIDRLERDLAEFDLARQNEHVRFLNEKISERTFSWSNLFDDLAEVLPEDVQLERVSPRIHGREGRRARRRDVPLEGTVTLTLEGTAKGGEEMLGFVDALFAHRSFREPNPKAERRNEDAAGLSFSLEVLYLPRRAPSPPVAASPGAEPVAATAADEETGAPVPLPAPEGGSG